MAVAARWSGPLATGPTGSTPLRGGGTDDIPPVPRIDPSSALLRDPQVPERDRYCRHGGTPHPVGRGREGRPGLLRGFCPQDGTPYSFAPPLAEGSLVAGQYEVRGALAHGGLGWIYLAVDRNVDDRWVVLKGVLDANDPAALAAARAERQFLAQLSHPNIVAIHNFVRHVDDHGVAADYIVMAYIGGSTLAQVRDAREEDGVLPVAHALTYMIKVLPALGYLHAEGHVYSDFKPDNVMQCERHLTLIDMGAVARIDDADAVVYGTVGYHAPEVVRAELSPASDLYTVGRTLAVLALGIEPARGGVATELPDDHPLLRRHESLHRLLLRATHPDPRYRFGSADEMAEQLDGVRREVLAVDEQRPRPGPSGVFSAPRGTFAAGLLLDHSGPGRPAPAQVAGRLPEPLDAGHGEHTGDAGPDDWRHRWSAALAALAGGDLDTARAAFDAMYSTFPGELAPKLALAAVAECAGDDGVAQRYYELVAAVDPSWADAAFGRRPHPAARGAAGRRRVRAARGARQFQRSRRRPARGRRGHPAPPRHRVGRRRRAARGGGAAGTARPGPAGHRRGCGSPCSTRPSSGSAAVPGSRCWAAPGRNARCGSSWNGACARWPGSPRTVRRRSRSSTGPTARTRGRCGDRGGCSRTGRPVPAVRDGAAGRGPVLRGVRRGPARNPGRGGRGRVPGLRASAPGGRRRLVPGLRNTPAGRDRARRDRPRRRRGRRQRPRARPGPQRGRGGAGPGGPAGSPRWSATGCRPRSRRSSPPGRPPTPPSTSCWARRGLTLSGRLQRSDARAARSPLPLRRPQRWCRAALRRRRPARW